MMGPAGAWPLHYDCLHCDVAALSRARTTSMYPGGRAVYVASCHVFTLPAGASGTHWALILNYSLQDACMCPHVIVKLQIEHSFSVLAAFCSATAVWTTWAAMPSTGRWAWEILLGKLTRFY